MRLVMARCHVASSLVCWLSFVCGGGAVPTFTEVDDRKHEPPRVGLVALEACTVSTTDEACTQNADMVEALDADPYIRGEGTGMFVRDISTYAHTDGWCCLLPGTRYLVAFRKCVKILVD